MKKKIFALICLAITVVMCFSSCTVLTRITSLFDKGGNTNSANEGDPNCTHLWSNGYVDTECETSKDAVLKTECYFCGKQLFTDIRTTITEEEFENIFNFEYMLPNYSVMITECYNDDFSEKYYLVSDQNYAHLWSEYSNQFMYDSLEGFNYGDNANNTYEYILDFSEYFFVDYPFEEFTYDEEQKCYVYTTNETFPVDDGYVEGTVTVKLYFKDGHYLGYYIKEEAYTGESACWSETIIDTGNTTTAGSSAISDLFDLLASNGCENAQFAIDSSCVTRDVSAEELINALSTEANLAYFYSNDSSKQYTFHIFPTDADIDFIYQFGDNPHRTDADFLSNLPCELVVEVENSEIIAIKLYKAKF